MKPLASHAPRLLYLAGAMAVTYALWLHYRFMVVMPDPIFTPDSAGYLSPALDWFEGRGFQVSAHRTLGYPLWVLFWLKVSHHFTGLLLAQHALVLIAASAAAGLAYYFFSVPRWSAGLIFLLIGALPRMLIYSHAVLTDAVYASILTFNVLLLAIAWRKPTYLALLLLGVGTWIGLLVKPVGLAFVLGAGLVIVIKFLDGHHRKKYLAGTLTFLVLCLATSAANFKLRGFWGFDQFGGVSLFGTAAQYLIPAAVSPKEVREILAPIYQNPRVDWTDRNWVRYSPEGPVSALRNYYPEPKRLNEELLRLSFVGISHHPWRFAKDQIVFFVQFLSERSKRPGLLTPKEITLGESLARYAGQVKAHPWAAKLVWFHPSGATAYFNAVAQKPLYPYEPVWPTYLIWPWVYVVRWMGITALIVTPFLLRAKETKLLTISMWFVIAAHIVLTNLGGDSDGRHALPIEPLLVIITIGGLTRALRKTRMPGAVIDG